METSLCDRTFVGQLCQQFGAARVISVREDEPVDGVLQLFERSDIISAPVMSAEDSVLGIVHLMDIASYLCVASDLKNPIKNLLGYSAESKTVAVYESTDRVSKLVQGLGPRQHHTCLVRGRLWQSLLTQADLVRFLFLHLNELPSFINRSIRDLGLGTIDFTYLKSNKASSSGKSPLVTVSPKAKAREALELMRAHDFDTIPIVEGPKRKIVNCIRSKDLRSSVIRKDQDKINKLLDVNVMDFLGEIRSQSETKAWLPTCTPEDSFRTVIGLFSATTPLQVWVVDPSDKSSLVGIIGITDVISAFGSSTN